jgi:hypothetical protein
MATVPDTIDYFKSLASELLSQYQRVRHLIGDKHWLSDGHHKEYLLGSLLERHMPSGVVVSRGFVADLTTADSCSREQDILVVDTRYQAPLFNQGGLIIAFPRTVIASISVKSTMTSATVRKTIENQNSVRNVCVNNDLARRHILCAGYFFDPDEVISRHPSKVYGQYEKGANKFPVQPAPDSAHSHYVPGPELICTSSDLFYRVDVIPGEARGLTKPKIHGYQCNGLATAVFLATIVDYIGSVFDSDGPDVSSLVDHTLCVRMSETIPCR